MAPGGLIEQLANLGFDGVYLDWVEAYDDEKVRAYAASEGVSPENEMMIFMERIKASGAAINSEFLLVPQNAPYLLDADPEYYTSMIDAIATEDTWFYGERVVDWDSPQAGDLSGGERHEDDYSTESRIEQSMKYLAEGIPVFTVDYCISQENADMVYREARDIGFIPLVTRVPLSDITETPPF